MMRHTVEQHCAPNCTGPWCLYNVHWQRTAVEARQHSAVPTHAHCMCGHKAQHAGALASVALVGRAWNVACRKLCGQHENVPCANAAAPDSDDDATKPRRAWPHSGYIAATQPRCGVRENRPTRTCTAACRNVGNARDGARTAHRVTRLPGMR